MGNEGTGIVLEVTTFSCCGMHEWKEGCVAQFAVGGPTRSWICFSAF